MTRRGQFRLGRFNAILCRMNDVLHLGSTAVEKRKQLIELLLRRTFEDVEYMRRGVPDLIAGDHAAWQELRFAAQRAAGMAQSLELGILAASAQELAALAEEKFGGKALDAHFLLAVTSAIEVLAIEIDRVGSESC
jgi:hypothetical protein